MRTWTIPYSKFGAGPGLDRVAAIAARLGLGLPSFGESGAVVVGSNGKGSTAAMCAALLGQAHLLSLDGGGGEHSAALTGSAPPPLRGRWRAQASRRGVTAAPSQNRLQKSELPDHGATPPPPTVDAVRRPPQGGGGQPHRAPVGLFTSPHLLRLNERFRIDGEDISDDELELHWERVVAAIESAGLGGEVGGFEFLFLIAADWFSARGCASTVWEAGIGGRLDPVRLIEARRVALTALDFEHTDLLGATLEAIACDKADAAPRGATLLVAPVEAEVARALHAHCAARGVRVETVAPVLLAPLPGAHQRANAALALALARDIAPVSQARIVAAYAALRWPGRLEVVETDPDVVIDVGHTPRGIEAALGGFAQMRAGRRAVLVCGVSADKDAAAIMARLAPAFENIVCTASRHKGARAGDIAALAAAANPGAEIVVAKGAAEARRIARAKGRAGIVYVAGSLFLAAEFKALAQGIAPANLSFF